MIKVYVASSWRNPIQASVIHVLREHLECEVYDFRNPPGAKGFAWSDIDVDWKDWDFKAYKSALKHPLAESGFSNDFDAMESSDACVLVLPCGRSAHIEAGYFVGAGKKLIIYDPETSRMEPELMYKMADHVTASLSEVVLQLKKLAYDEQRSINS